ncbi:DnaJ-class molecular chaperone with C-terminal Zn finger domain [Xenococcus sp. PCC 7305]|uniref:J domain-containing protein n=1 Tax=Xenococcus sp. PCC 7305 TaxID=102125 RepID=UPI0002ACE6B4|nr:DnaJ domain-containing protein [Xenococcus sp. PCC 7305]ELS02987.1 DnaJ-class molecular chaperone with C-terminal Zn finger domain [Xenococcus sp. PCC 7305]
MSYYQVLQVHSQATQQEIKQSYRRLAKLFHPDTQTSSANNQKIIELNKAYEVLSNPKNRRQYDYEMQSGMNGQFISDTQERTAQATRQYHHYRRTKGSEGLSYQEWMQKVYHPSDRLICQIIQPLTSEIENLAADPFDDQLLEDFQQYLEECGQYLQLLQQKFSAYPNPPQLANVAANLYYCLNHLGDGIKELEWFTLNYDEHYLHTGQEIFRIAERLRYEASSQF